MLKVPSVHKTNGCQVMRCRIPEGESGDWKVERFQVSEEDSKWSFVRAIVKLHGRWCPPGDYTRLLVNIDGRPKTMMSDTPDELHDHVEPLRKAKGVCLINGLGLGCIAQGMLEKKNDDGNYAVDKVIVVEKSSDVIKLVAPHLEERYGDRIEVQEADAYAYEPPKGEKYDVVWHDVWLTICADNVQGMILLHKKYEERCDWQDSWMRETCEELYEEEEAQLAELTMVYGEERVQEAKRALRWEKNHC